MRRRIKEVPGFEFPHKSLTIWRYMGLEKFLDLISSNRIRLTRASLLTDHRELRLPLDKIESEYYRSLRDPNPDERRESENRSLIRQMEERVNALKEKTYVSCWTTGRHESYALWKIYLGGGKAGVAIKSTVSSLLKAISPELKRDIFLARIKYPNEVKTKNLKDSYFVLTKSRQYEFESELRMFCYSKASDGILFENTPELKVQLDSVTLAVNPTELIKEIYVSPFLSSNFRKTLENVIKKVNPEIGAKVVPSEIRDV